MMVLHALRVPTVLIVDLAWIFCDLLVASDCGMSWRASFSRVHSLVVTTGAWAWLILMPFSTLLGNQGTLPKRCTPNTSPSFSLAELTLSPDPVIGYEGGAAVMDCGPVPSAALPSLTIRLPGDGPNDFSIIDSSGGRLTSEMMGGVVQFTYSGLMRAENGSSFKCNSGVTPSNIITLLVYCKYCMWVPVSMCIGYVHFL